MTYPPNSACNTHALSRADLQVLLVLKSEPHHGYGIVSAAEEQFPEEPPLEIGSLYRILARMLDDGLIREVKRTDKRPIDGRTRRFYQTTALGIRIARDEVTRLQALLSSPRAVELLEGE
jgi:DNA-binding PadR family transcriptional regulator